MWASVQRWFGMVSTAFKLILAMLGLSGLAILALAWTRRRAATADSQRTSSRTQLTEVASEATGQAEVHREQAATHLAEAGKQEAEIPAIDARLQAARDRVARLKKELNG